MKSKPARRLLRRPQNPQSPALSPRDPAPPAPGSGGPRTRGDTSLGRIFADLVAFFEIRTVSAREIDLLKPTHENGWLRPQIEAKLARLHPTCPDHQELRRLVTLAFELLTAVAEGRFHPGPSWPEIEPRLLRALAYLVREGDAIPDHLPEGFDDDMREFRSLAERATDLFGAFEGFALVEKHRQPSSRPKP
jgi:hypothetical protein